jgi:trk system potassium uptake protein TrkA
VLYGIVSYIRRDEFFASPFEFVLVDCVALAVIVQALYIVGGYSRNTEMRGLTYTTEHILAITTAAAISAMLIYSAATFDQTMKPSRGVLLLSFVLFLPVSLLYRRWIRKYVIATSASRTFLVIGSGTDPKVLESVNIQDADVLAAVTGADETNLVVSTLARMEYGVRRVVARVNNPKNAWLFTPEMGVDVGLNQADMIAHLVAEELSLNDMAMLLELHRGQFSLVEKTVYSASAVVGRTLRDIKMPKECVLVAVIRDAQLLIPRGDTMLLAGDKVMAITDVNHLQELSELLGGKK